MAVCHPFLLRKTKARYDTQKLIDTALSEVGLFKTSECVTQDEHRGEEGTKRIAHFVEHGKRHVFDEGTVGSSS